MQIAVKTLDALPGGLQHSAVAKTLLAMHQNPKARMALTNKGFLVELFSITASASIGVAIALYWLIGPVFGEEYVEALPAFLWLLPGIIAGAGSRIYANCIAAARGSLKWEDVLVHCCCDDQRGWEDIC